MLWNRCWAVCSPKVSKPIYGKIGARNKIKTRTGNRWLIFSVNHTYRITYLRKGFHSLVHLALLATDPLCEWVSPEPHAVSAGQDFKFSLMLTLSVMHWSDDHEKHHGLFFSFPPPNATCGSSVAWVSYSFLPLDSFYCFGLTSQFDQFSSLWPSLSLW